MSPEAILRDELARASKISNHEHVVSENQTIANEHEKNKKSNKIVHQYFAAQTHQIALSDPQIPPDAKTQVQRNVSRCTFYGNHTGPTQA
jgi:hypothetical protein